MFLCVHVSFLLLFFFSSNLKLLLLLFTLFIFGVCGKRHICFKLVINVEVLLLNHPVTKFWQNLKMKISQSRFLKIGNQESTNKDFPACLEKPHNREQGVHPIPSTTPNDTFLFPQVSVKNIIVVAFINQSITIAKLFRTSYF